MAELEVVRLLQNPLGQVAPSGQRGDMVRVSDGRAKIYLAPEEFDRAEETDLRAMLRVAGQEARAVRDARAANRTALEKSNASGVDVRVPAARDEPAGSVTSPRRATRRGEPLW
jgi:ribosomal protein L9